MTKIECQKITVEAGGKARTEGKVPEGYKLLGVEVGNDKCSLLKFGRMMEQKDKKWVETSGVWVQVENMTNDKDVDPGVILVCEK
jgi:hypothetical protein